MGVCTPQNIPSVSLGEWIITSPIAVTVETDTFPEVPGVPAVNPIASGLEPAEYTIKVASTTAWSVIDVSIPAVPTFDIPNAQSITPSAIPSVVTESEETTSIEEAIWSGTWNPTTRVISIPNPPNISLSPNLPDVPEFIIDKPVDDLDWVYTSYSSNLLLTLTNSAVALLTQDLPIATTNIVLLCKRMWNTPSNFLSSRGIENIGREPIETQRYQNNIDRLIDILEAQYRDVNDKGYVKFMQAIENLNRDMYDAKKRGELLYAKEFAQVKLMEYESEIANYNVLLSEYRSQALKFEAEI